MSDEKSFDDLNERDRERPGEPWRAPAWLTAPFERATWVALAKRDPTDCKTVWRRYGVGAAWMFGAIAVGLFLTPQAAEAIGLPRAAGLGALLFAMLLIIAVARRWSWVERDRDAYLITQGRSADSDDPRDAGRERIGFNEDLRDEALTGLVFLFTLIPLALMHVEFLTAGETFKFEPTPNRPLKIGSFALFGLTLEGVFGKIDAANPLAWAGYFGAELAKSVPFVDWSEVFHVPNGMPIKPADALGASIVFGFRAGLDLLVLAAVLQALSIANRTRQVRAAFRARLIRHLDPFDELFFFRRAAGQRVDRRGSREIDQPGVLGFSNFSEARLATRTSAIIHSGHLKLVDSEGNFSGTIPMRQKAQTGSWRRDCGGKRKYDSSTEMQKRNWREQSLRGCNALEVRS